MPAQSQPSSASLSTDVRPTAGDSRWFVHDRFGLFIHWGLYAQPARHEWVMQRERHTPEDYEARYFKRFDPDLYDPEKWAADAADAGFKYFCITTKHHEGFCLWDSKLTDYKSTNTAYGRDLLRPMIDAFRRRGLKVGLYHSLIDWHHPHYRLDDLHALRSHPERAQRDAGRDQRKYIEYLHGQVRELLTGYGKIDYLFFDFSYPHKDRKNDRGEPFQGGKGHEDWDAERLMRMCRELQPGVLINDRLDLPDLPEGWDLKTPEQYVPKTGVKVNGQPVVWEACQTFSGSWGYHRDEQSWKSNEQCVQMLVDHVSKGGNLLMNVGPTARGEFDTRALDRFRAYGDWLRRHGRSIYGCGPAPEQFQTPQDCRLTYSQEKNRLYVHVFNWPFQRLHMEGMAGRVEYAQLLNDGSEVGIEEKKPGGHTTPDDAMAASLLTLRLPVKKPDVTVPVVELFLK
jgi:alpha-L-fucosidase